MPKTVEIFIPFKAMQVNCGNCGFLGWKLYAEAINKKINGKLTKVGQLTKVQCGRCKATYTIIDGCIDGNFKVEENKPLPQPVAQGLRHG